MRHKETWNSDNHVQNKDLKNYKTRRPRQDFCLRLSERSGLLFVSIQWIQPLISIDSDLDSYSFHTHFIPPNPSAGLPPFPCAAAVVSWALYPHSTLRHSAFVGFLQLSQSSWQCAAIQGLVWTILHIVPRLGTQTTQTQFLDMRTLQNSGRSKQCNLLRITVIFLQEAVLVDPWDRFLKGRQYISYQ